MLIVLIVLAVTYSFLNGYRDSSSIVSGVIASRAMNPRIALYLIGVADFIAPFLFGLAVARSIGTGLIDITIINLNTITLGMASAILWSLFSWWRGIPSSSTHSMIGGFFGAALIMQGPKAILISGLYSIILPLFFAPFIAFLVGYGLMELLQLAFINSRPKINTHLKRAQIAGMVLLAMANSSNDAQKSMGVIALGLLLDRRIPNFTVPLWVIITCAAALAIGGSRGDWRQIHNLGGKIFHIKPLNEIDSQISSIGLIFAASALGIPVSTPHIISSTLIGSGAAERMSKIRWNVASEMLITWLITIPATTALSFLLFLIFKESSALLSHIW